MKRRRFVKLFAQGAAASCGPFLYIPSSARAQQEKIADRSGLHEMKADVVIVGGGLGGCAAALSALRNSQKVILTEETDWIGGQLTQQGVPPDEHRWIESFGATRAYRQLRFEIREYFRKHYPLTTAARARWNLNPGDGSVSRLCHEPKVALAVLRDLLAPYESSGHLFVLLNHKPVAAEVRNDSVRAVTVRSQLSGREKILRAPQFIDATELGDLLPLAGAEYVTGAESQKETGEPHAPEEAAPHNHQAFTCCFAVDYLPLENWVIPQPKDYSFWRTFTPRLRPPWPGKLLDFTYTHPRSLAPRQLGFDPSGGNTGAQVNLWTYRRIARRQNFEPGAYSSDISLINWPQNDYFLGNLIGVEEAEAQRHLDNAKQLSLSLLFWLQTEAPRPDGKLGYPGLRLRPDILGTEDGLAKFPYVRESRRIRALFTVLEQHVSTDARAALSGKPPSEARAEPFPDSVGIGSYPIDLHPSTGGDNYIDFDSLPFQIPLRALLPIRLENLIAGSKNLGVTHITTGCYRLHPVEWNIGEAAGALSAFAAAKKVPGRKIAEDKTLLAEFQQLLVSQGVETHWPTGPF